LTEALPSRGVLRHRDFALFLGARFLSTAAIQMQNVAVGWLVYDITRSAFALGLVGLVTFLPAVLFALVAGHVADRHDRRLIMVICYAATLLTACALLAFAGSGSRRVWMLFALVLVFGITRAFAGPAGQALLPNLVPREQLGAAIAWGATSWQTAAILGPALAGLLYIAGQAAVFTTTVVLFTVTLGLQRAIRPRPAPPAGQPASRHELLAGVRFIRSRPVILGAISLDLFAVLLGGATALLPIYARDILAVGPAGLGALRTMPAAGALVMALWFARRPLERHTGRRMFQAVALFGLATIGFGLSETFVLSLACLFVLGAADMVSVVIRQTLVQAETPDGMRGRVSAVNAVFIGASNELGEFESGALAALVGAVGSVVLGGVGTLVVAALWAYWFPALRERDRLV
jgi:MFS family permease